MDVSDRPQHVFAALHHVIVFWVCSRVTGLVDIRVDIRVEPWTSGLCVVEPSGHQFTACGCAALA